MTFLPCRLLAALVLLAGIAGLAAVPGNARAAESYDNCTGFIDSLPATISTQGVWCLRKNLGTAITSGEAINIATNNVTIDCNGFKIGGLAAGDGSMTKGIYAYSRQNVTVRNCNVRGLFTGIYLQGGAGHLVEDNRLDNNLYMGIRIIGDNNLVRRNLVYDTGGSSQQSGSFGINAWADVIDNTVNGVFATGETATHVYGIYVVGTGSVTRNNRVRGLQVSESGGGEAYGIRAPSSSNRIDGNLVVSPTDTPGIGILGTANYGYDTACSNNVIAGFTASMSACTDAGHNIIL